ncbi:MAG: alanine racemase, partial [Lachnospiraceae bacterium]|nr:alanine racemase [Lachnospiraceae bacterium]
MDDHFYRVQANIDLDAVRQNILNGKKLLKAGTRMMVVVKADAYGHGAYNIVKNVDDIADAYAVAIP